MLAISLPPDVLAKPAGSVVLDSRGTGISLFVREDSFNLKQYPRPCSVELVMPIWDKPPVIAAALLVRLARRDAMTHQIWINAGNPRGIHTLKNLSTTENIEVHVVTDRVERSLRTPNTVKRHAMRLLRRLAGQVHAWDDEEFDRARASIDTLYPTPARLWIACRNKSWGL